MEIVGKTLAVLALAYMGVGATAHAEDIRPAVDEVIKPLMAKYNVPGLSVGILRGGSHHIFHYGVSSIETSAAVNDTTLFEIGSLSKPFTGTLLARLQAERSIDLSSQVKDLLPEFAESRLGAASLLNLQTYVAGGLPLQFPDEINEDNFAAYYKSFQLSSEIGSSRLYSNPSIGFAAYIAAKATGASFDFLLNEKVIKDLGLKDTFLLVPDERFNSYAQGYTSDNKPVRVRPGVFDQEAYGIKTTAADLLRFVGASAKPKNFESSLETALIEARSPVYRVRQMHQGLGWELYRGPARRSDLSQGVDPEFVLKPSQVETLSLPTPSEMVATVSKTGSTSGFGAYALFQPARGTGIVILANKFWPNSSRIDAAQAILEKIDPDFFEE